MKYYTHVAADMKYCYCSAYIIDHVPTGVDAGRALQSGYKSNQRLHHYYNVIVTKSAQFFISSLQ